MKIVSILLIMCLVVCCTINSNSHDNFPESGLGTNIIFSGMHYGIYSVYNGGAAIVNITKDSLECEYYRKQLLK